MAIDSDDHDYLCTNPDCVITRARIERGLYWEVKEWDRRRARVLSRPPRCGSFFENAKFYASKRILELKYNLMMYALEEKVPRVYRALVSIGLPEPKVAIDLPELD